MRAADPTEQRDGDDDDETPHGSDLEDTVRRFAHHFGADACATDLHSSRPCLRPTHIRGDVAANSKYHDHERRPKKFRDTLLWQSSPAQP